MEGSVGVAEEEDNIVSRKLSAEGGRGCGKEEKIGFSVSEGTSGIQIVSECILHSVVLSSSQLSSILASACAVFSPSWSSHSSVCVA